MSASPAQQMIREAAIKLKQGGIIAYPTESVVGLGCDPSDQQALRTLLDLKSRPDSKGLILVASDLAQLEKWVDFGQVKSIQSLLKSWPGPETWIVPAHKNVSKLLTGDHSTLAVRVSAHPVVVALCKQFHGAITSTSANLNGQAALYNIGDVKKVFNNDIDYYVDGSVTGLARPSRIRDAISGAIIRD